MSLPISGDIHNPEPVVWPYGEEGTPDMEGPVPSLLLPCGCHLRRPDYEVVLCEEHLADLNAKVYAPKNEISDRWYPKN